MKRAVIVFDLAEECPYWQEGQCLHLVLNLINHYGICKEDENGFPTNCPLDDIE